MNQPKIDYDHAKNDHGLEGPREALPIMLEGRKVRSVLDVGCGTGTWLHAALGLGTEEIRGIDGIVVNDDEFLVPRKTFSQVNLEMPFDLKRHFDAVLCLEVAEHLEEKSASQFIASICRHGDLVFFSAACPGQPGQHHVNCQWPDYWQSLFNQYGYVCDDNVRWRMWSNPLVEVWYRQNMFMARRDSDRAGQEPRLPGVIHPEFFEGMVAQIVREGNDKLVEAINQGRMPRKWYSRLVVQSAIHKARRKWASLFRLR